MEKGPGVEKLTMGICAGRVGDEAKGVAGQTGLPKAEVFLVTAYRVAVTDWSGSKGP